MIAFVFFAGAFAMSWVYVAIDSHRRNREWDFDPERESLRRALEPFTGRTR